MKIEEGLEWLLEVEDDSGQDLVYAGHHQAPSVILYKEHE